MQPKAVHKEHFNCVSKDKVWLNNFFIAHMSDAVKVYGVITRKSV